MNIFISYSASDTVFVQKIAEGLKPYGIVHYWAESREPGLEAWATIFSWIDAADLVFVLITGETLSRAMSVGQEIGRAKAQGKFIVPLVEHGIPASELGVLGGITYIQIDPKNSEATISNALEVAARRKDQVDRNSAILAIVAVIGIFTLLSD